MKTVSSGAEVLALIRQHAHAISEYGVLRLGLFGSFARGTANAESDVDLLVEFDPARKNLSNLVGLSAYLHELFSRKVELVTPESLNRFTGHHILNEVEYVALAA